MTSIVNRLAKFFNKAFIYPIKYQKGIVIISRQTNDNIIYTYFMKYYDSINFQLFEIFKITYYN